VYGPPEIKVDRLEVELAGLDLGDVQDVVDDEQQVVGRVPDGLQVVALLALEAGLQGYLGHADDGVHGRADLVAHLGQELALGPVGGFGFFLGLLQRGLDGSLPGDVLDELGEAHDLAAAADGVEGRLIAAHFAVLEGEGELVREALAPQDAFGALGPPASQLPGHGVVEARAATDGQSIRLADDPDKGFVALQQVALAVEEGEVLLGGVHERGEVGAGALQRRLGPDNVADVGGADEQSKPLPGLAEHGFGVCPGVDSLAVLGQEHDAGGARRVLGDVDEKLEVGGRLQEVRHRRGQQLLDGSTEHGRHGRVGEGHGVGGVQHEDALAQTFHEGLVAPGALLQRVLGEPQLLDFLDQLFLLGDELPGALLHADLQGPVRLEQGMLGVFALADVRGEAFAADDSARFVPRRLDVEACPDLGAVPAAEQAFEAPGLAGLFEELAQLPEAPRVREVLRVEKAGLGHELFRGFVAEDVRQALVRFEECALRRGCERAHGHVPEQRPASHFGVEQG